MLRTKRIYEPAASADGFRVLVDRIWPRGVKKSEATIDLWLKELAPSTELRRWFGHDAAKWSEFRKRYKAELKSRTEALALLRDKLRRGTVTLVYASRDTEHNNAVALAAMLDSR
ncbi:MAG: DUF488 domain-containing protein [Hyphomicrobiales bacterium]|nr:DUF488 domain-containing protein [Hyphomicrobiales bacterium]